MEGSDALGFEAELWASANKLRGNMDASEYKHVVLPLVFLKYISDAFEDTYAKLEAGGRNPEILDEYLARGIFWVPREARWSGIVKRATDPNIGVIIDDAMEAIGKENPDLKSVLVTRFGQSDLSSLVLGEVITLFGNLPSFGDEDARTKDVIGRVYEYFIGKFAQAEKKSGGEFYTPRSLVGLLVDILQPFEGRIYDGCCGSGGMFIQSHNFVQAHSGKVNVSIYGQESNATTWRLAKMNLAIRQIEADLGDTWEDTLLKDLHPDLRADYVIVNPPFNIKDWGWEYLQDDPRWKYGVPPKGNANYAWIQHYMYHLAPRGIAGIVMSNGSLSAGKQEKIIRDGIIASDKLDCVITLPNKMFANAGNSACIFIIANDKKDPKFRNRSGEILFMDCRDMGEMISRTQRELTSEEILKISETYHFWRGKKDYEKYEDERGFCKSVTSVEEIKDAGGVIVPGLFVGIPERKYNPGENREKIEELAKDLSEHFQESRRLESEITKILEGNGFEI